MTSNSSDSQGPSKIQTKRQTKSSKRRTAEFDAKAASYPVRPDDQSLDQGIELEGDHETDHANSQSTDRQSEKTNTYPAKHLVTDSSESADKSIEEPIEDPIEVAEPKPASGSPIRKKKSGGPKTPEGKSASSRNAIKDGLLVLGCIDDQEKQEYEQLVRDLQLEYPSYKATIQLQINRMAMVIVRMRRLQRVESALWQKCRCIARRHAMNRPVDDGRTADERDQLALLGEWAVMPDTKRLELIQRYLTSLDRQMSKIIGEIQVLSASDRLVAHAKTDLGNVVVKEFTQYDNKSTASVTYLEETSPSTREA